MFKKLKDKLAEEVKSSPQRIQQFAQAAQAAVTSASSSLSDITNNDLFSIGDNDGQQNRSGNFLTSSPKGTFRNPSPGPSDTLTSIESVDYLSSHDTMDIPRQRKLSNSSVASDVSFRFPSYESPSMYHLQSDMEISASEAEERGFASGSISLDRVTKEQIYAAYRRTQDRYKKYRTQYADLARHYKLLERENAKAKSVLVETQDKALRRISELREQCALEQSAKAHLEKVMRDEIDEKNIKIGTLDTKIKLLQSNENIGEAEETEKREQNETNAPLINISVDNENNETKEVQLTSEIQVLNMKIGKMEQLLNKYKESLKISKDKNSQLSSEITMMSSELESRKKENDELKTATEKLVETRQQIQELNDQNEELQNKINAIDFSRTKEMSCLEEDFRKSQHELETLRKQIEVFTKREEENAISLAENKLRIHKELESKEAEIKSLKDSLAASTKEIESLNIVINDYKHSISDLENENSKYNVKLGELNLMKDTISELQSQIKELTLNCQQLENNKAKANEEYKCLQLQMKQETAEKLAMIDRNTYLEDRNAQLQEENSKKSTQIGSLESEIQNLKTENNTSDTEERTKLLDEISIWKDRCSILESEIQEEREELVKLQTEIEKLLTNHRLLQEQNTELHDLIAELKNKKNNLLKTFEANESKNKLIYKVFTNQIKDIKGIISSVSQEARLLKSVNNIPSIIENVDKMFKLHMQNVKTIQDSESSIDVDSVKQDYSKVMSEYKISQDENKELKEEMAKKESKIHQMEEECITLSKEYENTLNELTSVENEKQHVLEQMERTQTRLQNLQEALENETDRCLALRQENEKLISQLDAIEDEKKMLRTEMNTLRNDYDKSALEKDTVLKNKEEIIHCLQDQNNNMMQEKNYIDEILRKVQVENESLKAEITMLKTAHDNICVEHSALQNDHQLNIKELKEKVSAMEEERNTLNKNSTQNSRLQKLNDEAILQNDNLQKENKELVNKLEEKCTTIKKLEECTHILTQENNSLRMQSEKITSSVQDLESELDEVRKSHSEMETEKERLNLIIDKLEKTGEGQDKNIQTDNNYERKMSGVDESFHKHAVSGDLYASPTENNSNLAEQNNMLQEENRRLQLDITSLQAYLAKISKENSVLNDRLRELMASSENCMDKNDAQVKNEVDATKEKVDELLRENNLLMEENLELKDQLNSQNRVNSALPNISHSSENEMEYKILSEKYNSTLDICKKLENRMSELEQMNRSINGNMNNVQDKNEKLKLTNEKLERRLDEALVSLRHLHSLQENTELEYLRNILYEYLTGSGTHSLTLAKVLSAVVKFDDSQTQQVLVKEKERQGFLRQLGII